MDDAAAAWRKIVVDAMMISMDLFDGIEDEAGMVCCLVESGYSLFDIRDHWEELKAARFRYYGASATSETAGQTQHLALKGSAK